MKLFKRKENFSPVQTASGIRNVHPFSDLSAYSPFTSCEFKLYDSLKEAIPVIDAAIKKTVRLVGGFKAICEDENAQIKLAEFLRSVNVNGTGVGIDVFVSCFLEQLLTYGTAVGEVVLSENCEISALYNASLDDIVLKRGNNPLDVRIYRKEVEGNVPIDMDELISICTLSPKPGNVYGTSLLKGLPFISGILMTIFNTVGTNWERVGNVRFAVSYKPADSNDRAFAKERTEQIAKAWTETMHDSRASDFVSVGDVSIKVIGADNQILDSEIPVRQLLEQIVSKLSIPPFLLGLQWSSTERMASQQADILTSELEYYRRLLEPTIRKICGVYLRTIGFDCNFTIEWDNINLQDETELAQARLNNANAEAVEIQNIKLRNEVEINGQQGT